MKSLLLACAAATTLACASGPGARTDARPDFGDAFPADVVDVLVGADALELMTLDPGPPQPGGSGERPRLFTHGITGSATLTDPGTRARLLEQIAESCREGGRVGGAGFRPRHGVGAEHDGRRVALALDFRSRGVVVLRDGAQVHLGVLAPTATRAIDDIYRAQGLQPHSP